MRDGKSFASLLLREKTRDRSPDTFRIGILVEKLYLGVLDK